MLRQLISESNMIHLNSADNIWFLFSCTYYFIPKDLAISLHNDCLPQTVLLSGSCKEPERAILRWLGQTQCKVINSN